MQELDLKTVKLMIEQGLQEIEEKQQAILKRHDPRRYNQEIMESFYKVVKVKQKYKQYQEKLNMLEEGADGIVFGQISLLNADKNKASGYGLSDTVMKIVELKVLNGLRFGTNFQEIKAYANTAAKVLYDMRYYEGDKLEETFLGLPIYENPKNHFFDDIEKIENSLTEDTWKKSYVASSYFTYDEQTKTFRMKKLFPSLMNQKMSLRETEAFYGQASLQVLGIDSKNSFIILKKVRGEKR